MNATQPSFISWEPEPTRRGTSNIIFTCLSTLAFCVWGSVHIDIIQSRRNALVQRLLALILGLLAPEVLLIMAYSQRRLATKLVNEANEHLGIQVTPQMPWYRCAPPQLWSKLKAHFILWRTKPSDSASERPSQSPQDPETVMPTRTKWTLVHGFYAVMGGFVFDASAEPKFLPNSYTRAVLTPEGLQELLKHDPELIPDLSDEVIMDKSKADGLAKGLLLLQAFWFCINCLSRLAQSLPLSLLEVTTLAHALCTLFTYILWWHKPLSIREPTLISGDRAREICAFMWMASRIEQYHLFGVTTFTGPSELDIAMGPYEKNQQMASVLASQLTSSPWDRLPRDMAALHSRINPTSNFPRYSKHKVRQLLESTSGAWYSRHWHAYMEKVSLTPVDKERWALASKAFLRYNPTTSSTQLVTAETQSHGEIGLDESEPEVPIKPFLAAALLTAVYGAPHIAAWNAPFPSYLQQVLWHSAAVVVTITGTLASILGLALGDTGITIIDFFKDIIVRSLILILPILYTISSAYLIVESFIQLSHLPPETYQIPSWSNYIPHFS